MKPKDFFPYILQSNTTEKVTRDLGVSLEKELKEYYKRSNAGFKTKD
jgi:hypothetical protein